MISDVKVVLHALSKVLNSYDTSTVHAVMCHMIRCDFISGLRDLMIWHWVGTI